MTTTTTTDMTGWIRPWWPGHGAGDHTRADCPELAKQTSEPVEGSGWLDPNIGLVCPTCVPPWNAECRTCDASMVEDDEDGDRHSEADAKQWIRDHRCYPQTRLLPPVSADKPPAVAPGQATLPLTRKDAAA